MDGSDDEERISSPSLTEEFDDEELQDDPLGTVTSEPITKPTTTIQEKSHNDPEPDSSNEEEQPRRKKSKKSHIPENDSFSYRITVLVAKDTPPTRSGSRKAAPNPRFNIANYVQKDPFKFASDGQYNNLLSNVAKALGCSVDLLREKKLQYKFKTPQAAPILAMGTQICFEALVDEVISKTAAKRDVYLISLLPRKLDPDENTKDDTGNHASSSKNDFDYEELVPEAVSTSIAAQKMKFDATIGPHCEVLKNKYKIDNYPDLFPNKRMFKGPCGGYWELDPLAIANWALKISQGFASITKPPNTAFFDYNRRKLPPLVSHSSNVTSAIPVPSAAPVPAVAPIPSAAPGFMEFIMAQSMQSQQQMHQMQFMMQAQMRGAALALPSTAPLPMPVAVCTPTVSIPHSAPSSPAAQLAIPTVLLDDFGARYNLSATVISQLERLGYKPGSPHVTKLQERHWEGANFSVIGSMEILDTHARFLCDVRNGLWA
ncbi:hypothetical protein BDP27DRAFT_1372177 [Rhodocollybia butyracea]|uniref:Uncharacterized protein n=1 Tax=Rhodocollybia butyracea TaxID=206335 RepID=A0A9P5TWW4_9AGAR|nr:hypothetical protein BDP27DRAFT_1372177 [Rhodocollybia butyracea]